MKQADESWTSECNSTHCSLTDDAEVRRIRILVAAITIGLYAVSLALSIKMLSVRDDLLPRTLEIAIYDELIILCRQCHW